MKLDRHSCLIQEKISLLSGVFRFSISMVLGPALSGAMLGLHVIRDSLESSRLCTSTTRTFQLRPRSGPFVSRARAHPQRQWGLPAAVAHDPGATRCPVNGSVGPCWFFSPGVPQMWALSPSLFDLLTKHLSAAHWGLAECFPAVHYALLNTLCAHSER